MLNTQTAKDILERKINQGRASAMALVEHVNTKVPKDKIIAGFNMLFNLEPNGRTSVDGDGRQGMEVVFNDGSGAATLHEHALGQLANRAGIPSPYVKALAEGHMWERELLARMLNDHYHMGHTKTRFLTRRVGGELRGFLSDRYRRLDSRPLIEALSLEAQKIGAVPVDGTVSDTRVALKVIIPQVYEPIPGEALAFGLEWANSDFGNGKHAIRAFMLRVACLNGATMENALAQVHLGGRLTDDIQLSEATYKLDTDTSISALRDVVAATLAPAKVEALCAGIRTAHEEKIEWKNVNGSLSKRLLKTELKSVKDAFESSDNYNLPEGNTMWRASNAVSWIAGQKDVAPDRKLELERIAGELVDGKRDAVAKEE